jgi:cytochrome c553
MKVDRAKGRLCGKQPKLNRRQEAYLVSLVHSGAYSTGAEPFGKIGRYFMVLNSDSKLKNLTKYYSRWRCTTTFVRQKSLLATLRSAAW